MKCYRGVFFDFDYTLGDSTGPIVAGFQSAFAALGLPVPEREAIRRTVGLDLEDGFTRLTGDARPARRAAFRAHFLKTALPVMVRDTVLLPGARDLLEALRRSGTAVAIVSTKRREQLEQILCAQGVDDLVALVIGGTDVSRVKPDPEGIRLALSRLQLRADEVLFAGDTVIDAEAARRAGLDFCAVLNGTTPAEAFDGFPRVCIARNLDAVRAFITF